MPQMLDSDTAVTSKAIINSLTDEYGYRSDQLEAVSADTGDGDIIIKVQETTPTSSNLHVLPL